MKRHLLLTFLGLLLTLSTFAQRSRLSTRLSRSAGFKNHPIEVTISASDPEARIFYTTDGSIPSSKSLEYRNTPIKIEKTTILRAYSTKGELRSNVVTKTYFTDEPGTFPTVSIAIKPSYLFHPDYGLFEMGPRADSLRPHYGANFWSRKEVVIHTEIFDIEGSRVFSGNTGMRLFGGMSRLFPQKSLALVTRSRYGPTRFKLHAFPDKPHLKKFKYLVLRNTGSDWGKANMRDVFVYSIINDMDLEMQAFYPTHVYINGSYWGMYNMREKVNRYFLSSNRGFHKDSVHILEHSGRARRGDAKHYKKMLSYMKKHDLGEEEHFEHVGNQMEIRNFTDLQITQIYIDNQDAGGNIKFWRPMTEEGKWRWVIYDMDWGYSLHEKDAYRNNSLEFHLEDRGPRWPNPPWSTFILRNLIENEDYQRYFVNRFCDHLNTYFETNRVTGILDSLINLYEPEIGRHIERWNMSESRRDKHLSYIREFAEKRPGHMRKFLAERFDGGEEVAISVDHSPGGRVVLNENLEINGEKFNGIYFENIPIHLKAYPRLGYRFVRWIGLTEAENNESAIIDLSLNRPFYTIKAIFEKAENPLAGKISFNEISCNNNVAGDWVELYNSSDEDVELDGWFFYDAKDEFIVPKALLKANDYLVLAEDAAAFRKAFPTVTNVVGNFDFGLSKTKERLELYTNFGAPIDSVSYVLEPQDSIFTLSLLLPHLNNSDQENWEISQGVGSPNAPNPSFVESHAKRTRSQKLFFFSLLSLALLYLLVTVVYRNRKYFK